MKRSLLALSVVLLIAAPIAAIEIRMHDGSVIEATSYTVTGSYVMLELADGRQVAYDVVDVDLEALAEQEPEVPPAEEPATPTLSQGRHLAVPPADDEQTAGLAITDQDVKHVRGSAAAAAEEADEESEPGGVPEGYVQGGGVVINNLQVTAQGQDRWLVEGEVINRTADPVINVRVQLQTLAGAGEVPWTDEVAVASTLQPNGKGAFSRGFSAQIPEDKLHPDVRASVIWMQHQKREQEPPPGAVRAPRPPGPIPTPEL